MLGRRALGFLPRCGLVDLLKAGNHAAASHAWPAAAALAGERRYVSHVTGPVIGIDLGTSNSCVAVLSGGVPVVIENAEKSKTTPSIVAYLENGQKRLVGDHAKNLAFMPQHIKNTFFATKRILGRKFNDPEVSNFSRQVPYKLLPSMSGEVRLAADGFGYSPVQVAADILMKLRRSAEARLKQVVKKAVIAVPAYFDENQRSATVDAGRLAGLTMVHLINEPSAAALAYGLNKEKSQIIAVFDIGGGTLDVSLLQVHKGTFRVLSTGGDGALGGEDFDHALVTHFALEFKRKTGIDVLHDTIAMHRLKEAAETAKMLLSSATEAQIEVYCLGRDAAGSKDLEMVLSREIFEKIVEDCWPRVRRPCKKALQDAGLEKSAVDEVILAGAMSKVPRVRREVADVFGREPNTDINPDEAVAVGAAIQGAILTGNLPKVRLVERTSFSLGIETSMGAFEAVIPRNTPLPASNTHVFTTSVDGQTGIEFSVLQGEDRTAGRNKKIGEFILNGLTPAPRGSAEVVVTFQVSEEGLINVSARDEATGVKQQLTVGRKSGKSHGGNQHKDSSTNQ